jgi:zinc protease
MKRVYLFSLIVLLFTGASVAGERRYPFAELELGNGMKVITLEDFSCPIVAVQVWYHVGAKNEDEGRQGFAHMFEHMMFRGTDRLSETGHFDNIRRVGGNCNAYTAFDQTVYVQELPSNQLELVLWLESERMAFLKIDKKGFETERKVVEEELRMGHNRPYGRIAEKLLGEIYGDQCYGWTPGGQISHLRQSRVEEVSAFWDRYYAPNNATLVVVGAAPHETVQRLAREYFEWIPPCPQPERAACKPEKPGKPKTIKIKEDKGPLPVVGVVYHAVAMQHEDYLPLQMLMGALGGGESSRLYVDIVKDKKIAQVALAGAFAFESAGIAGAGGVLLPFGEKKELMKIVKRHIGEVRKTGITEEELEKMKTQQRRSEVLGALTVANKARLLGQYAVLYGDAERINRRLDEIDAVTLKDVQRVAAKYLTKDNTFNISIEPSVGGMVGSLFGGDDADNPDEKPPVEDDGANRVAKRTGPKAGAERPEGFPVEPPIADPLKEYPDTPSAEKTLDNGLRVIVVSNHEVPMVSMTLGIKSGSWSETMPGVAQAAMDMLTQGTTTRDAKELAKILESNAVGLSGSSSMDTARVQATALLDKAGLALELMRDVIANPTFPRDEFDIMMKQTRMGLLVSSKTPEYLAEREFRRQLYGDHPYSRTATGELDDLDNITPEAARQWWSRHVRPENAVLYLAGDLAPEDGFKLAAKYLEDWKVSTSFEAPILAKIPPSGDTHIYLYDRPGSVQSQIRVGHRSIRRSDPLYFTSRVLDNIFGGGFNSRLNKAIRVDKGLTYGARGGISANRFDGELQISTFTKTPSTAETIRVILDEIGKMRAEPPADAEVRDTQTYLTGAFPGNRETPQATVGDLWMIETEELPTDYLQRYLDGIRQTKATEVLQAARTLIDPEKLVIVVVGEASKIKESLEQIAPVTVVNAADEPTTQEEGKGDKSVTMR